MTCRQCYGVLYFNYFCTLPGHVPVDDSKILRRRNDKILIRAAIQYPCDQFLCLLKIDVDRNEIFIVLSPSRSGVIMERLINVRRLRITNPT